MVQIEMLTDWYNSRNIHQPQSSATNLKIQLKLSFIGFLGLPDCRRASSQGCLEQRWRRKSLSTKIYSGGFWSGSTDEQDIGRGMVVKKEKQNVYQIRRQQFRQCRRSSCQTCWKGCNCSLSALWWLEKTDLLTRRATKGPTSWMVPARIPPKNLQQLHSLQAVEFNEKISNQNCT